MYDAKNSRKILVVSWPGIGHVNACCGLALPLSKLGHKVAFFIEDTFKGKLERFGFEEFFYETQPDFAVGSTKQQVGNNPGDRMSQQLIANNVLGQTDRLNALDNMIAFFFKSDYAINNFKLWNDSLIVAISKFQPDLFMVDMKILLPAIYYSKKPWILVISSVPLFSLGCLQDPDLPPACSGLSIDSDKSTWIPYKKILHGLYYQDKYQNMIEELGYDRFPEDCTCPQTQILNVYAFPEEYNYSPLQKYDQKWFNIEVFNKNASKETVDLETLVPEEFYGDDLDGRFSGKWIYVSMGSMGSADLNLMKQLIDVLGKTDHKYIVSKGPKYREYELKRNMWGDRYLPQEKILPSMDLVITHGGNNSITETFAQGKAMIVFPLFADQYDNGQRLHETNHAVRLNPYSFTEKELIESIERILNDQNLKKRLAKASERILQSRQHDSFCHLFEKLLDGTSA